MGPTTPIARAASVVSLTILALEKDFVVIAKPPGRLVVPDRARAEGPTLFDDLKDQLSEPTLLLTHRLDRDTTGVLVFARNKEAQRSFTHLFEQGRFEKTYLALVNGVPLDDGGRVTYPIAEGRRSRRVIRPDGKASATRWRVIERFPRPPGDESRFPLAPAFEGAAEPLARTHGHALVECEPETGRTHQIRVHLAALGLPIVADPFYDFSNAEPVAPRCALHAAAAAWEIEGRRWRIEAPLPHDLADAVASLRAQCKGD